MFGNTGFIHKPVKKTKKEIEIELRKEARLHAVDCDHIASALRKVGMFAPAVLALEKAAKFIRRLAGEGD